MKAALLLLAFFALIGGCVFADGYPFDPETQQVMRDTLRVRLNEQQVESLSASGSLILTDAQLALVHRFLDHRQVNVCVAPPFRSVQSPWRNDPNGHAQRAEALAKAVAGILTALTKHGEAHKVIVSKSW